MTARCARCQAPMDCRPGDGCWCEAVPARLPLAGEGCLCPACLDAAIKAAEQKKGRSEERPR